MEIVQVTSFVRGYHVYLEVWEPKIGDEHCFKREPNNKEDDNAVTVVRKRQSSSASVRSTRSQTKILQMKSFVHPNEMTNDMEVVGHIPKLMARWVTKFLKRANNSGTVIIKGERVNRGAGYGVELPCKFTFKGDSFSCSWLKDKLKKEKFDLEH